MATHPLSDVTLTCPPSDLVGRDGCYAVKIAFARPPNKETGTIRLKLKRCTPGLEAEAIEGALVVTARNRKPRELEVRVDAADLADGEYAGELTFEAGDSKRSWPVSFFRMPDYRKPGIPFGIYAVPYPGDQPGMDATLALIRKTGLDLLCMHMNGIKQDRAFLDRAARFGLSFCPSSNMNHRDDASTIEWPDALKIKFAPGAPSVEKAPACFNQPEVRRQAADSFAGMLRQYKAHPAFSGLVYYGDDLFMHPQNTMGKAWISCYCPRCREDFKKRFGFEPPFTTEARHTVVPANDQWLAWMQYRCRDVYGGFIEALMASKNAVDPAIQLGLCHGWPDNPFTSVATGIYTPLSQKATDVVSSYCYPFLRAPASDFICHYEFGKMNNRDKDVWMLGLFLSDGILTPDWEITQNYWNMLAAGYKFIAFFSWWNYTGDMNNPSEERRRQTSHALDLLARCGAHKDWILPAARHWQDTPARTAALYSFTTEACDIEPHNRNHRHMKELCRLYRNALAKQVQMNLLCEEEICAGILDRYDALCLHDVRALADDVHARIQAFANKGKLVLVDPDYLYADGWHPNMQVSVRGAIELTSESMAQVLADRFPASFQVSNPDVTTRRFTSGVGEYYVFVNNFPDRYHGMTYWYGEKQENYKRAALVRSEPAEASVTFKGKRRFLFDMTNGKRIGNTAKPMELKLEPAWGRVIMALPVASVRLEIDGPASITQGQEAHFKLRAVDGKGKTIDAAFAARVTIHSPSGRPSRLNGYIDLKAGKTDFVLPTGCNEEPGDWRLVFEGGSPRRTVNRKLRIDKGTVPSLQLKAKWI